MGIPKLTQTKENIRSWWQRRGNKSLPEWYFFSLTTLLIVFLIFWFYGSYTYRFIQTIVQYVTQKEVVGQTVTSVEVFLFFTFLVFFTIAIYGILIFALLYMRKRTRYTFRRERKTREMILRRDYWSFLHRLVIAPFFLLAYYQGLSVVLLHVIKNNPLPSPFQHLFLEALTSVASAFTDYFPAFCTLLTLFLCTYLMLNLGLGASEKLPYIADSLANLKEPKTHREYRQWKRDIVYFSNALVKTFGKLGPFDYRTIEQVDLSLLKPILLALFLGNIEEKNKARKMLSELQEYMNEDERKREVDLIDWLSKIKESAPKAFPRLKRMEDILTMKLVIRKGLSSKTSESIKYIAKIIAILVGLTTIISVIFGAIQILLTWVSNV